MPFLLSLWLQIQKVSKDFCEKHLVCEDPYEKHDLIVEFFNLKKKNPEGYKTELNLNPVLQDLVKDQTIEDLYANLNPNYADWETVKQRLLDRDNPELSDINFDNTRGF